MADSRSGGGQRDGPYPAGDPIHCPSGCKLHHNQGDDLNLASCDCDEGYYDRERQVFYSGTDVRDKKSPETRGQYLRRIAGTDADPNVNRQGDYFVPRDGIRYDALKGLKDGLFGKDAQIWEYEINGQPGWLIRALRRNYAWKAIIERLQQQSRDLNKTGLACTERAPPSGAQRVRRPLETQPALSSAGPSGTKAGPGYTAAPSAAKYGSPSYSSQSGTAHMYTQARQSASESAAMVSRPLATPAASPSSQNVAPQYNSAPGLPRPRQEQTEVMSATSRTDRDQRHIRSSQDTRRTPGGHPSERPGLQNSRFARVGGEDSNEDEADEPFGSESQSHATTRAAGKRSKGRRPHDMPGGAGHHALEEDPSGPNYVPTSRTRETQSPATDRNEGRDSSHDDLSDVPRALTESTEESASQPVRPPPPSSLPTRPKGTAGSEKQKRKHPKR